MNRPYYSEYVRHIARFYFRHEHPTFNTDVDKDNWKSCESVVKHYTDRDKDILKYVYGEFDTLADNVYQISKKYDLDQQIVWDMMRDFERKVAKRRCLI